MPTDGMPISDENWELLQKLARSAERPRPGAEGWVAHTPAYKPLVWLKLVDERERAGGGIELRLTDFGWSMLADGLERADA